MNYYFKFLTIKWQLKNKSRVFRLFDIIRLPNSNTRLTICKSVRLHDYKPIDSNAILVEYKFFFNIK